VRRRLLVSYLGLTLLILLALEIPLALSYRDREVDSVVSRMERDAFVLSTFAEDSLDGSDDLRLKALADEYQDRTGVRVVFVDANATLRADTAPESEGPRSFSSRVEIQSALNQQVTSGSRYSTTLASEILYAAAPVTSAGVIQGAIRLSIPSSAVDVRVQRYWALLGLVGGLALTAAAALGIALSAWVTRPLEDLQRVAISIGNGDLQARARANAGPQEIQSLARSLNLTASRLEELVGAQDQFVADASHQLRTPLTALRLRLEMLDTAATSDQVSEDLAAAEREVIRLSRLVDGLLALARADRSPTVDVVDDIDVDTALTERASNWRPVAATRGIDLAVVSAGFTARMSPDRLDQIVDNYLANAIDVAPVGSTITLRSELSDASETTTTGPMVEIHVEDEGPGLTEEQRNQAFDRFWRSSDTSGVLGGTGLGLPIVRKLVTMDGGYADLRQATSGGLDAVVVVPSAIGSRS
jgi:signal transduction histidine kinase